MSLLLANFSQIISYIGYILLALLVLLVMITVHEFGHYITGKIFKFKIDEFAVGFGPKLYQKKKKKGEIFSLRLIPLGGFCAFSGEDEEVQKEGDFNAKPAWQRIIVLISGALMNYLLAVILIALMFGIYGHTTLMTYHTDGEISGYSKEYSFQDKDVIIKANGKNVYLITDLMDAVENKKQGDIVEFKVLREEEVKDIKIKLRADTNFANLEDFKTLYDSLGITYQLNDEGQVASSGLYSTGVRFGFFRTLGRSFEYSIKLAGTIFRVLGELLTGALGIKAMGGTVTTISTTATAIKIGGFRNLLNIASFIGVNLAVFNLLPIPALDGARVVFTSIEWVRGKPINRKVEGIIHTVGLVLLLLFAVFVDVQQCF